MSHYLAQLKALLAEMPLPEEPTKLTEGASVSFVSDQSNPIFGDADSDSGRSGSPDPDERRALVRWMADNFRSSPSGVCAHCCGGSQSDDPFVILFVGEDRADIHASCYPRWLAEQESSARVEFMLRGDSKEISP
jgi:hypothetical protein